MSETVNEQKRVEKLRDTMVAQTAWGVGWQQSFSPGDKKMPDVDIINIRHGRL